MARLLGLITQHPVDFTFSVNTETAHAWKRTHGWGIGWYDTEHALQIQKEKRSALYGEPHTATQTSCTSHLLLIHQRIATSGGVRSENVHPFTFGHYVFAHTGTVHKDTLLALLYKPFGEKFQSEPIDSEVYFRYVVQCVKETQSSILGIAKAVRTANDNRGANFILLDGKNLFAYCYGLPLYFLRWNKQIPLDVGAKETDGVYKSTDLAKERAIIVCSEKLTGDNWMGMDNGELFIGYPNLSYEVKKLT